MDEEADDKPAGMSAIYTHDLGITSVSYRASWIW